jgi:two-component SAPR family response regulator
LAKITRPKLSGISGRSRLFRLLDAGRSRPTVWIAAEAGSGKTTLVASYLDAREIPCLWYQVDEGDGDIPSFFYFMGLAAKRAAPRYQKPLPLLTPEYLPSIPVFTRRFFEELFRRIKPPAAIVFDNYQDAPAASGFHEMMTHALETVPEGFNVVILSRIDPPPPLARLQANNRIHLVGWDDIRFTREESAELLKTQGHQPSTRETVNLLHGRTEGWAAGLILLMAGAGSTGPAPREFGDRTLGGLFDYFASEIFDTTDTATQEVLLKTSFLGRIEPADAERLTGNSMAGPLLEQLSRNHYFTQIYDRAFQYHPLFREFLQNRAQDTLSPGDIARIRGSAALILEESGRFEEAAGLYLDACDWMGAERLLLAHAGTLVSQGRSNTLEGWLKRFPRERVEGAPWLLYWSGSCRLAFDPLESRRWLEKAYARFKVQRDSTGVFLSWSGIIDTFTFLWDDFTPLDRWIAEMEGILGDRPVFPSPEIEVRVAAGMMIAMTNRQPWRPELSFWGERVRQIVLGSDNVQLQMALGSQLIFYSLWIGDFSKVAVVIETLRPSSGPKGPDPLSKLHWFAMEAMYSWFAADWPACSRALSDGLKTAEESGIHLLDLYLLAQGVYGGLCGGDPATAESCLEKMSRINSPRPGDKALHLYLMSNLAWYHGDYRKSAELVRQSDAISEKIGWQFTRVLALHELAVALFDDGRYEEADASLARTLAICRGMNFAEYMTCLSAARFAFDRGKEREGLVFLKQGLALGERYGYQNLARWNDAQMSRLFAKALEERIETEYVKRLIAKRGLVPERPVENWPYPIRIHTLGRFRIDKESKPLVFTGKVQKKPLELLKALIALGGEHVAEERITEAMWPDADGDTAHRSFETTLYRLRKLVGEKVIHLQDGQLTLDGRWCWVDAWDFESRFQRIETSGNPEMVQAMEKALALYRGHFLPADTEADWSVSHRERLRQKFIRLVTLLGAHWEESSAWDKALQCFRRAVETDELVEEFHRNLMRCHIELGQRAEAAAAYHRCRTALQRAFELAPSARTRELYASLRD